MKIHFYFHFSTSIRNGLSLPLELFEGEKKYHKSSVSVRSIYCAVVMAAHTGDEGNEGVRDLLRGLGIKLNEVKVMMVAQALAILSIDSAEDLMSEDAIRVVTEERLGAALVKVGVDELAKDGLAVKVISALKKKYWANQDSNAAGKAASSTSEPPIIVVRHYLHEHC